MDLLVSVVITTKDRPELLSKALDTVVIQTYKHIEIIIVDDCSACELDIKYNNVYIIRNDSPMGGAFSRNIGAKFAKGDIICFLDDDDFWAFDKVEKQVNVFEKQPDIGLVYTGRNIFIDSNYNDITKKIVPKESGCLYPRILFENPIGVTSSVAIKKSIFDAVGGFDETLPCRQDYDLWIRLCKLTKVSFCEELLLYYRISSIPGTQISNSTSKHVIAFNIIIDKYKNEIKSLGWLSARKIKSNLVFSIAKSFRRVGYWRALIFSIKSILLYPNVKSAALLLPKSILSKFVTL